MNFVSRLCASSLAAATLTSAPLAGAERLSDALDFDGDRRSDLALRQGDRLFLRRDAGNPDAVWTPLAMDRTAPLDSTRLHAGDLDGDGRDDLLLSFPQGNRAWRIAGSTAVEAPHSVIEWPVPGGPTETAISRPDSVPASTASFLALESPQPRFLETVTDRTGNVTLERIPIEMDPVGREQSLELAVMSGAPQPPASMAWLHRERRNTTPEADSLLTWFGPEPQGFRRAKWGDITLKRGVIEMEPVIFRGASVSTAVVVYAPGETEFITVFPPETAGGRIRAESTPTEGIQTLRWTPHAVESDAAARDGDGRLLAVGRDGRTATVFRATAEARWEVVQTLTAPENDVFRELHGLAGGGMASLMAPATASPNSAATRLGVYAARNGRLELAFLADLPVATPAPSVVARVLLFDRDPFRDPNALELESLPAGDWVRGATIAAGGIEVSQARFQDTRRGLGAAESRVLTPSRPPPAGAFALGNQWEADSSLHFGVPPAAPQDLALMPTPAPGSHPGPIRLQFVGGTPLEVFFQIGTGPWQSGRGPAPITETASVTYYGVHPDGRAGERRTVRYVIAAPDQPPRGPLRSDTDADRLDDAWERLLFGGLERSGQEDSDGDGYSDSEEYTATTDPGDPASVPAVPPLRPPNVTIVLTESLTVQLEWSGTAKAAYRVESSEDLSRWQTAGGAIESAGDKLHWQASDPPTGLRFYRVIRER